MKKEIKPTIVRFITDEHGIINVISDWAAENARPSPPLEENVPIIPRPIWIDGVKRAKAKAKKEAKEAAESDEQPQD